MKAILGVAAAMALVASGAASAHDEGAHEHGAKPHSHWWLDFKPTWYAGGSLGQNSYKQWSVLQHYADGSFTSRTQDDGDTGLSAFVGMGFFDHFALELGYGDFGEASVLWQNDGSGTFWSAGPITEKTSLDGFEVDLIAKLPLVEGAAIVGRVGAFMWQQSLSTAGTLQSSGPVYFSQDFSGTSYPYAVGLEYDRFRPLRVVATYSVTSFKSGYFHGAELKSMALSLAYLF